MKNILFLSLSGEFVGGAEFSLLELLKRIDRKKFNPIFASSCEGNLYDSVKSLDIKTYIIPMFYLRGYGNLYIGEEVRQLFNLIGKEKIALVHSNHESCAVYGGIAARLRSIPSIWHLRVGGRSRKPPDTVGAGVSTKIIAVSKSTAKRFSWLHNQKKITVIYNGVDINTFTPLSGARGATSESVIANSPGNGKKVREDLKISDATPVPCIREKDFLIGCISQLLPFKGHKWLIQAVKEVAKEFPEVKLLIVGKEIKKGYLDYLHSFVKELGIDHNVIFSEFRKDIPALLNTIDLPVLPSTEDHCPRVLLEAMGCGKPIVATKSGGVPEIVKDRETGILVPPQDSASLRDAILYFIRNPAEREKMGKAGRKRAETVFNIEQTTAKIENVYEELLFRV